MASKNRLRSEVNTTQTIDWASDKQEEAFKYGPFPLCISGGFGSAKTYALCLKVLWLMDTFPGNRGLIGRKVWEELKHTTMSTFFKICPPELYERKKGGRRSDSEKYLRFTNGSELLWAHLDDPETENVIRGLEINFYFIDQAEEVEEEMAELLMSRLGRWDKAKVPQWVVEEAGGEEDWKWHNPVTKKPIPPVYAMLACNPDTEMHWIYRQFHPDSIDWQRKYKKLGYKMISMASYENKFLPKQNLELMMQRDESFRRRFVHGEWGIPEGQIHTVDTSSILHTDPSRKDDQSAGIYVDHDTLIEYFRRSCTLHRSMDHGDSSPTCCLWWAVNKEGMLFCYREYYQPDKLISDHRLSIAEMSEGEKYTYNLADPSIFHKVQQKYGGRWSVSDEYMEIRTMPRKTVIHWQAADNNELGTRNRISEYLRVDPKLIHPITKQRGSPRIFFLKASDHYPEGVNHALQQLRTQRREKVGTELGKPIYSDDRDQRIPDHGYDPIRYFVASRPPVRSSPSSKPPPGSWDAICDNYDKFERGRGWVRLSKLSQRQSLRV